MQKATAMKKGESDLPVVTIVRSFDAPRELMYKLWAEPEHIKRWWAPHDFTVPLAEFDAQPGSRLRIDFRTSNGFTFANYGEVKEAIPPERLVFTTEYSERGKLLVVALNTVTFEEIAPGKTKMTLKSEVTFAEPEAADSLAGMEEGWTQQIEKLQLHAVFAASGDEHKLAVATPASSPVILMTRMLDAPRELVWKCLTEKERFVRWWGPRGYSNEITDFDLCVDGKWRVVQKDPDGNAFIFFGFYREIRESERLVNTFAMENMFQGKEIVETVTLEDVGGRTKYTVRSLCESFADRDGMVASGMEWGAGQSLDRLEEELQHMAKGVSQ